MGKGQILEQPLVAVAGDIGTSRSYVLLMHEGFDQPMLTIDAAREVAGPDCIIGAPVLVRGDLDNPYFSWPEYLLITER